jgi:hypothetical protein
MVQFFRSRQHDGRRRVATDDLASASPPAQAKPSGSKAAARRYATDSLREKQSRLIDFIPQSLAKLFGLFLLGLAAIAAIEAVYATRVLDIAETRLPAFDLTIEGSLNNWFTAVTLDLAGIVALIVYSLRRHRLDDYHGRYRVWLWAAACWLWLSIDEAASLHESFQGALSALAGQTPRETEFVSFGLYAMVIGGVGLRLLFEMRACRTAIFAMTLVGVAFAVAVAAHFAWLPAAAGEYGVLIEEGCEMGGSLLLLLSMCLYARYVILDSQGLLASQPAKEPAKASRHGLWSRKTKIDAAHATVRPSAKRSDLDSMPSKYTDDEDETDTIAGDDEDEPDQQSEAAPGVHRLSKAERKALRRQQEKQRKTRLG